jgi:hypothetical protein
MALWWRHQEAAARPLILEGGRHFTIHLDSAAPRAEEFSAALSRPDLRAAEGIARAALQDHPESPGAHVHLGLVLQLRGQAQDAIAQYLEAQRLDPHHEAAGAMLEKFSGTGGRIP